MSGWYFGIDKQRHGPVSESQLQSLIGEGKLAGNSPVWREGFPKWVRLDATELSKLLVGPPPLEDMSPGNEGRGSNVSFSGVPSKFQFEHGIEAGVGLSKSNMQASGHVATRTNVMAFAALALALAGFFTGVSFIPAIVCGHMALSAFRKDPSIGGEGLAKTALIMSYIVVGIGVAIVLAVAAFYAVMIAIRVFSG